MGAFTTMFILRVTAAQALASILYFLFEVPVSTEQ